MEQNEYVTYPAEREREDGGQGPGRLSSWRITCAHGIKDQVKVAMVIPSTSHTDTHIHQHSP